MSFHYGVPVPDTDPNCHPTFTQSFRHKDWIDGVDVVQAAQTSDEDGFNLRFHRIEQDLTALAADVASAFNCIAVLRTQLVEVLNEIQGQLNTPTKTAKEGKDTKDSKDTKDTKDGKDVKDVKDTKDGKDVKDVKDSKDGKDTKDSKDFKDDKDGKDGKEFKDGSGKEIEQTPAPLPAPPMSLYSGLSSFLWDAEPAAPQPAVGHAFIQPHERPVIGERALKAAEDVDR
jgi:hypothetical protein